MEYLFDLAHGLEKELLELKQSDLDIKELAHLSTIKCRDLLRVFKKEILKNGFSSQTEEIRFFKTIKQIPMVPLIYFSEIHSFEVQFPKANRKVQQKSIKRKIQCLNQFFLRNLDFERYVDAGYTYFDQAFYTRDSINEYYLLGSDYYFQDPDFSTPRDMLLAKLKSYKRLLQYLDHRLISLNHSDAQINGLLSPDKLPWPFGDVAFAEMVYALFHAGLKNENLTIIQIYRKLQEVFDVQIKDIYKLFQEMKSRKKSRTAFLDKLMEALLEEMERIDAH